MATITVREKSVYGNTHMYITDAYFSRLISGLTGRKTVSARDLQLLSELGFTIVVHRLDGDVATVQPTKPQGSHSPSDGK